MSAKNIYLIDGHGLCYRAYYAIKDLRNSKGFSTNAIYGVINILRKLIKDYSPESMIVVFDVFAPTIRHVKYDQYKKNRKPMPEDLVEQLPKIKQIFKAYGIPIYEFKGYEADDVIATFVSQIKNKGFKATIVSSDKDMLQLVDEDVCVLKLSKEKDKVYNIDRVKEKYGVSPKCMPDLMAFIGDVSDNVPGVKGIGLVIAMKILQEFGSFEKVFDNLDNISSKSLKKKLIEGKDMAKLSLELVKLKNDIPLDLNFDDIDFNEKKTNINSLIEIYKEFEFNKLLLEIMPKEQTNVSFEVLNNVKDIKEKIDIIRKQENIVLGFINYSLEDKDLKYIVFFVQDLKEVFFISFNDMEKEIFDLLKNLLESSNIKKIGYNIKNLSKQLYEFDIHLKDIYFDIMIADYLINPSLSNYSFNNIVLRHLDCVFSDNQKNTDVMNNKEMFCFEAKKIKLIYEVYNVLLKKLEATKLMLLFNTIEMPLVKVLSYMENIGVSIDLNYLKEKSSSISKDLEVLVDNIYNKVGEKFNINSSKQLQTILYDKLKLPIIKKTKTGASTDESVLKKLSEINDVPKVIMEYRLKNKLKSTYYDSIYKLTDKKSNKLFASFNQTVTSTGRLSSSNPNLQNIPKKTNLGKEIRGAFVPLDNDSILFSVDYSQIELKVLAHLSLDEQLLFAFNKGIDVHSLTASLIFENDIKNVTEKQRNIAKTVNFGIIYGISAFRLANDLELDYKNAKNFIEAYFTRYKGVKDFIDNTINKVKKDKFVTTLLGRIRYIPEIDSSVEKIKEFAKRISVNTIIQGSAADIIKLVMIKCYEQLNKNDVKMIMQIHDELIFSIKESVLNENAMKIKKIMEGIIDLKVPLNVDMQYGKNWLDMSKFDF